MQQAIGNRMDTVEASAEPITAPTGGRRMRRKRETRARIEEAAYALFRRQGVDDTSIEQICVRADVARRTFYSYYPNKHALLGGLGVSRIYSQSGPMLAELMANHSDTRSRLAAMVDYLESRFASYGEFDRQLILLAPATLANDTEQQRGIAQSANESFRQLFEAGKARGDTNPEFSSDMLAAMVVGTITNLTTSWALDPDYPVFAKLEEARRLFDTVICR